MDWTGGYASSWTVRTVDPRTRADSGTLSGVLSAGISRDCTDDVPLLETATMEVDSDPGFSSEWLRVYMTAEQGGAERHAMATLLFERQSSRYEMGSFKVTARGRSVLQPAADRVMPRGSFAAAGTDGASYAGRLVRECTPFPVVVEGSFTLSEDVVFDIGASNLEAAWLLLNAGGWCIQVDGYGTVYMREKPSEPSLELSRATRGLLLPGIDDDLSLVDVPNRFYAVNDDDVAIAVNDDPDSVVGRPQRGRWVDMIDESPTLVDGEPLEAYARRRLAEESVVTRRYTYEREWWPGVLPFSVVRAVLPETGMEGDLRVERQELECGHGVVVTETSGLEIAL